MKFTAAERALLAGRVGIDEQFLYQCLTGRRAMKPEDAVRVERESDLMVRRWDLRRNDWHRIWPELIGADGAPSIDPGARDAA